MQQDTVAAQATLLPEAPCACDACRHGYTGTTTFAYPPTGQGFNTAYTAAAMEPFAAPYPVPEYPPRDWFYEEPEWFAAAVVEDLERARTAAAAGPLDPTKLPKARVDDEGRVAGVFYPEGACLVHNHGACPGPSPTMYAAFHQSETICADGMPVICGLVGDVGGHADPYARIDVAQRHYADPSAAVLMVRAYDKPGVGGVILGSVVPGKTYGDVAKVRRHPLSGDWRPMPDSWWAANEITRQAVAACEGYDCIGPTFVNRPGTPLAFRRFAVGGRAAAILGGVGGVQIGDEFMGDTKIELPGGITVTQNATGEMFPPPGPHARTADAGNGAILADAPPPPGVPGGPPKPDGPPDAGGSVSRDEFDGLSQKVEAMAQALDQLLAGQMAAMEAAVDPLPEPAPA